MDDEHQERRPGKSEDKLASRRAELDKALSAHRKERVEDTHTGPKTNIAFALRLSTDFVAGVLVGAAIGWGLDTLAGTSPWGLIVFLLLGFAAGVLNIMRSAGLVAEPFRDKDGSLRQD